MQLLRKIEIEHGIVDNDVVYRIRVIGTNLQTTGWRDLDGKYVDDLLNGAGF